MTAEGEAWRGCALKLPGRQLDELLPKIGLAGHRDAGSVPLGAVALCHSADFGSLVSDDPLVAARVAIANALSDLYAVGADPVAADLLLQVPSVAADLPFYRELLEEAESSLRSAGVLSIGGHTAMGTDARLGCSAMGLAAATDLRGRTDARPGDVLVLTKPIGIGAALAGVGMGMLGRDALDEPLRLAQTHNAEASRHFRSAGIVCCADVTGFGLLGSLVQVALASDVRFSVDGIPVLGAAKLAIESGCASPIGDDTLVWLEEHVSWSPRTNAASRLLMVSPETSGGLVGSCSPSAWAALAASGAACWRIGEVMRGEGAAGVDVDLGVDAVRVVRS